MKAGNLNDNFAVREQLPANIEAEKAILGAFLNNNEHVNKVADFLNPEHFYIPIHRKIYEAILSFMEKGLIASPITIKSYFDKEQSIMESGASSIEYLTKLSLAGASLVNLLPYAKEIYDTAIRRHLIEIGEETIADSFRPDIGISATDVLERAEQKLFNLAAHGDYEKNMAPLRDSVMESLRRIEMARKLGGKVNGITTGFIDLDKLLGGMQNSDLIILAARPSMGKTALAISIALNASEHFLKVTPKDSKPMSTAVFSLEMSSEQIANRLLSIKTKIDGGRIRVGSVSKEEFDSLSKESSNLNELPIYIDDTPALTISAVRTRARRLKRQHNLGLIVIDYLQLLRGSSKQSEGSRVQEISEISQGLKAIAKELDIPVVALSQLSRAVESREDKRPQLSDLRESGSIEQDADVVMFLYREEYYLTRTKPSGHEGDKMAEWQQRMERARNLSEVIIGKQRNGPIGTATLWFNNGTTGFDNYENSYATITG